MFEELAKESETCEANKTASVTDATPDVSAAQQDAAPSQAL